MSESWLEAEARIKELEAQALLDVGVRSAGQAVVDKTTSIGRFYVSVPITQYNELRAALEKK